MENLTILAGSACSTPFTSAPSSPPPNLFFFSAPTSPTAAKLYAEFTRNPSLKDANFSAYSVPFVWEDSPGIAKNRAREDEDERIDFEFDFSGQLERASLSADELFHGGKIKPLKPPPRLQVVGNESETELSDSARFRSAQSSPRSSMSDIFFPSPKRKLQAVSDPFTKALEEARKSRGPEFNPQQVDRSLNSHKKTRSLSAFRVADILSGDHAPTTATKQSSFWGSFSAYRKWRIRDLLFRSASEGRATENSNPEEVRSSSFRSTDASEFSVGSSRRRSTRVPVSAHELHYKLNRAVSQEMRKKTFLPYKQGLLGCLGFVPIKSPGCWVV